MKKGFLFIGSIKTILADLGEWGFSHSLPVKVFIGLVLVVSIALMYPYGESIEYSYSVGTVWASKDLVSPFAFPIEKDPLDYEREKQVAAKSVYPVFIRDDGVTTAISDSIMLLFADLRKGSDAYQRYSKKRNVADSAIAAGIRGRWLLDFSEQEWAFFARSRENDTSPALSRLESILRVTMMEMLRAGIVNLDKVRHPFAVIAVRRGTNEDILPMQNVFDLDEASGVLGVRTGGEFPGAGNTLTKIFRSLLRPNLIFNEYETNRAVLIAQENVPRTIGFVQENERIVAKHDLVTEETKLKLDSFRKAKAERGSANTIWTQRLGTLFHVSLVVSLFTIYLYLFRKKIYHDNAMLALIALLLIIEGMLGYLSISVNIPQPIQYLVLVPAASMLLAIIFDSRVAFYGTVTMAFIIAGIRGNDYGIALASMSAGALGAYTVRDIRYRTQIFRSLIFIFFGYFLSIVALGLQRFENIQTILTELMFALANAVFSPVVTYGLLIFFERVFRVTTDLTLLELSDFNHPLLRELSEKAPGTFHHSMTIGNLAEAAADAIEANSILARVGAYYHDIGKMIKPEYFVENQVGSVNRHNRLKPRMSALIISSHVKEGIDLGRQYNLPDKILDFIPQHHGTTVISYFFDKALKQAAMKEKPKDTINEDDFRYPGPKPQSKEAGIVMLADSVEASTRALKDLTPQKLELAVGSMIKHRFLQGQLDDCDLTLKDLTKIKEAFLKILMGIHHQRIQYPEPERPEQAPETAFEPAAESVPPPAAAVVEQSPVLPSRELEAPDGKTGQAP